MLKLLPSLVLAGAQWRLDHHECGTAIAALDGIYRGSVFRISVPSNCRELPANSSVTFAPEGAFGEANRQSVFTHGAELGLARNEAQGLEAATTQLIQSLAQANPRMGRRRAANVRALGTGVGFERFSRTSRM